ncbi:response regulator [Kaarinaea lacus]
MKQVLVIEDNPDIANLVGLHLKDIGAAVRTANNGDEGFKLAVSQQFDLVVLDLMLPGMDGIEICKRLRAKSDYTPVLMLTAKSTEIDRIIGLEIGADDYLTKPFSVRELMARVKAIFRRVDSLKAGIPSAGGETEHIRAGDLDIDVDKRQVTLNNRAVELTAKEFDLLVHFAKRPGQVFTRTQLLDAVWGYGHDGYEHTVNSHINRLRAKIEDDPGNPKHIMTVWGVGYKFTDL